LVEDQMIEVLDLVTETRDHEKCLMQNAGTVERIVKYHSNQNKTDLYTAENASKNINPNLEYLGSPKGILVITVCSKMSVF
jgi:RNA recognition motif-containing protein